MYRILRYIAAITLIAFIVAAVLSLSPRCRPGDRALYVGGMLMAGCPEAKRGQTK